MNMIDTRLRIDGGADIQAEVTGKKAPKAETLFEESRRDFIFGEVWTRPGLDHRARYLIAITGSAMVENGSDDLDLYIHGALKSGMFTLEQMRETALHVATYAGWATGSAVDKAVTKAAKTLKLGKADTVPLRSGYGDAQSRAQQGAAEFHRVMSFPGAQGDTPYLSATRSFVFGEVWCRRRLDERSRRWLTLVAVCESCAEAQIKSNIYAAMASGNCTPAEMQEFVLAYAIHAGWPKASAIQTYVYAMIRNFESGMGWSG